MAFRIFTLPFDASTKLFPEQALNEFLLNKNLLKWKAEFFSQGGKSYWTVFVEYEPILEPLSKKEPHIELTKDQELLFQRFREWRKEKVEKQGVPVYIIANNKILELLAVNQPQTLEALKDINGLGEKKVKEYGKELIHLTQVILDKKAPRT